MAQPLPSDASEAAIEDELQFLDVMIDSLDTEADDFESRLAELEDQKTHYNRRLRAFKSGAQQRGQSDTGMDGASEFWRTTTGGPPGSARRLCDERTSSPSMQQNGLKRSYEDAAGGYPSKRPTPDPSNGSTPSSTGSFEWVDHPSKPIYPSKAQQGRERAREDHRQREEYYRRRHEAEIANEKYARQLQGSQEQTRASSSSSSVARSSIQTTLNPSGSFSRPPKPSPAPALISLQEQKPYHPVRGHAHPSPMVKPEPSPSKHLQHNSPLATRTKPFSRVVDLTGDSSDDDLAEVGPSAFSPSNRRPQPAPDIPYQNRPPFDPNKLPPTSQQRQPPPRHPMPGSWPAAVEMPSANNSYVYSSISRPPTQQAATSGFMGFANPLAPPRAPQLVPTPYNGARAIGGDFEDQIAQLGGLFTPGPRTIYGGSTQAGSAAGSGHQYGRPVQTLNSQPVQTGNPFGGAFYGAGQAEDDEVIFGGSRPRAPGEIMPGGRPAGYANQETYRQRFDEMMNQNPAKTMEEINALMDNIRPDEDTPENERVKTPEALSISLHKYQELGLTWLQRCESGNNKGGILADDMGLGKTIQMLSLIVTHRSDDPRCKTTLIVAPVALMRQWKQEIETRVKPRPPHRLSVLVHHGQSRKKSFSDLRFYDVVLTTFGTLAAELKKLEAFALRKKYEPHARPSAKERCALLGDDAHWYRVILDEAQCIKNNNTQGAKAACRLHTKYRFCMTGTPMMNNVDELWSLIHFLRIKPYCERHHFQRDFTKRLKAEYSREDAMKHLQALIRSIMLRRTKQSKFEGKPILQLPTRTTIIDHPVFSDDEKEFYKALEERSALQFNKYLKAGTIGTSYSAILVLLLRLRQACCHPHLIRDFGVSAAAGVSPDTLIDLAKMLDAGVVERIKATNGNFECPVCYDAVTNPAIFVPCGHDTCQECFAKIADNAARNGDGGGGIGNAKCPNCRGDINSKRITDFDSFKKVHMQDQLTEAEQAELQKLQDEFDDSETETDDGETDSDDDDDDDEVNANGNLRNFVVKDDEEIEQDSETELEADEEAQAEDEDDDNFNGPSNKPAPKGKDKGKAKAMVAKPKKSRNAKGKKREKREKKKAKSTMTLAELKKAASRSASGRKAYIKKLSKDWVTSAKIEKTMELLKEIMETPLEKKGERVLVFSQWTSLLDLLECPIDREGWGYRRYDGSMNAGMRGDAVDDFRDPQKDVRIMLVSLKAGNAGLNLNMASQVIILDPFWNPYIEEQAIDRAHRIGQEKPVTVHRMLIQETVEDRIIDLQEKKRALISDALDEQASQNIARLGARELAYLFGVTRGPDENVNYRSRDGRGA